MSQRKAEKITVSSRDPEKNESKEPKVPPTPLLDNNKPNDNEEPEEDRLLREKLETNAKKITEAKKPGMKVIQKALQILATEIQTATGSMTSVPKPLKYLRPFYDDLRSFYLKNSSLDAKVKVQFADVLSVLAMTMAQEGTREMLKFKLEGNSNELGIWGHEYVRALCGEISQEYHQEDISQGLKKDLKALSRSIVPFLFEQNTETEAVDLLFEVEDLVFLLESKYVEESNYERTCLYLTKFAEYVADFEHLKEILLTTYELYLRNKDLPLALRIALMLQDKKRVSQVFGTKFGTKPSEDLAMKQQLGYILGTQKAFIYEDDNSVVQECISNENFSTHYTTLGQSLNLQEAKSPEDVYKTHLFDNSSSEAPQSAKYNLSATYVNAFVNCGFTTDALLEKKKKGKEDMKVEGESMNTWVFNNKEKGRLASVASLGMISMWNPDVGSNLINEWLDKEQLDVHCYAGGLLGLGLTSTGVASFSDTSLALIDGALSEVDERNKSPVVRTCAALGIGLTFAGNINEAGYEKLKELLSDSEKDANVRFFAALSIGLMYVGTGDSEAASEIALSLFNNFEQEELQRPAAKFLLLGWALIYLGKQDLEDEAQRESMMTQLDAVVAVENTQLAKFGKVVFDCCAYAGSGNVIQVQKLLHLCAETLDEEGLTQEEKAREEEEKKNEVEESEKKEEKQEGKVEEPEVEENTEKPEVDKKKVAENSLRQSMAVLGISLITFADPVGRQMADRTFQHLLQYGELAIRRAVPLAMALTRVSDPEYGQIDILSKLTHDSDMQTSMSAILALGIMSAGTTNSRVAQLLRQLAVFYKSNQEVLQVVRISQGLLFTGKGLLTLHPFHSDRTLMSPTAVAALMVVMTAALDIKNTLLGDFDYLFYTLSAAMRPRMCLTLLDRGNGKLEHVKVKVRVGEAVETVGLAGNPKTITGFQTQETPVLLNVGDRVELATEEYEAYTSVLEGVVVLKPVETMQEE